MKEVEVSYTFDVPRDDIESKLSPRSIVEYEGTFTVRSAAETDSGCVLSVANDEIDGIVEMELEFTETEDGYLYEQAGDGVFDEMVTEIHLADDDPTRVTARSWFTFGGIFAFVKDWVAATPRRNELERLLHNLALDLEGELDGSDAGRSATDSRERTEQ